MSNWLKILMGSAAAALLASAIDWRVGPLVFAVGIITFSPMARRKRLWFVGDVEGEYKVVARRREEALRGLKDLEDDRLAGKLPADEYDRLRPEYLENAKKLTAQLDKVAERRNIARRRIDEDLARSERQA